MPVAGLDVMLEDAGALPPSGVTATVESLSRLIEEGRPEFRDKTWVPHRPPRPEKSEGGVPSGSSPTSSRRATSRPRSTNSCKASPTPASTRRCCSALPARGKTFTMAKVIEATQRPALILAPNKTLAAQLYGEFKIVLSGERGRIFRLLLRLLSARSLRPAHRHLHREGNRRSTSRSTACATRRRARCSSATTR